MKLRYLLFSAMIMGSGSLKAEFSLAQATGILEPDFRGDADTTWFGWTSGSFDGPTDDERIVNPVPTVGNTSSGVSLTQAAPYQNSDILAGSNNIYTGVAQNSQTAALTLVIPTDGTLSFGFTTIIIQGITNSAGGFAQAQQLIVNRPVFGQLGGYSPVQTVFAVNANNTGQWWVKYEIPGNEATYTLTIDLPGGLATDNPSRTPISIAGLNVDTAWSNAGYASDIATVPEPSAYAMLATAALGFGAWAYRRRKVTVA